MRVRVDPAKCAGHAQCAALCPEIFDSDNDGYAVVLEGGLVPAGVEDAAEAAIAACPEQAISTDP